MIYPLRKFTIKGVIWYQGESNGMIPHSYYALSRQHIKFWRELWSQNNPHLKDMPFLTVQIAPFNSGVDGLAPDAWAYIRDAQLKTLPLPNTGLAVITDIGEFSDIHPQNKQPVGERLALWAEKFDGISIEPSGPIFENFVVAGNEIKVYFTHADSGLETRRVMMSSKRNVWAKDDPDAYVVSADKLAGFSICGIDRNFVAASARIVGGHVEVFSEQVSSPIAVRYGWSTFPLCNLYNKEGLPASPFRTDNFPVPDVRGRLIGKQWSQNARGLGSDFRFTGSNPETRWEYAELGGVIGNKPVNGQKDPVYAYYKLEDDNLCNGKSPKVIISMTYFDNNDGTFSFQYDSSDPAVNVVKGSPGAWKQAAQIQLRNTGKWNIVEIAVPDALFAGRCNGADIRINSNKSTIIGSVYCRKE